jgi:ankyrin repeat protein
VFDVTFAGDAERLATLLAADPARAHARHPRDGGSPLHVLASRNVGGCEPLIDLLLAHGADREARNNDGQTALQLAIREGADEVAAALLRHGADPAGQGAAPLVRP